MVALYLTVYLQGDAAGREAAAGAMRELEEAARSMGNKRLEAALTEFRATTDSLLDHSGNGNGTATGNGAFDRRLFRLLERLTTAV